MSTGSKPTATIAALLACLLLAAACTPAPQPVIQIATDNEAQTRQVLELLLSSHHNWFQLDAKGWSNVPAAGDEMETLERATFYLGNPNQARVDIMDGDGALQRSWVTNGTMIFDHDHISGDSSDRSFPDLSIRLQAIPATPDEVTEELHAHPMASLIPTDLATYIFPAELAQIPGEYRVAGEESIDDRPTWQLDYTNLLTGDDYRAARYWVDQATGIVLLAQYFGPQDDLLKEYWIHIEELDGPIYEDYFRPWF